MRISALLCCKVDDTQVRLPTGRNYVEQLEISNDPRPVARYFRVDRLDCIKPQTLHKRQPDDSPRQRGVAVTPQVLHLLVPPRADCDFERCPVFFPCWPLVDDVWLLLVDEGSLGIDWRTTSRKAWEILLARSAIDDTVLSSEAGVVCLRK